MQTESSVLEMPRRAADPGVREAVTYGSDSADIRLATEDLHSRARLYMPLKTVGEWCMALAMCVMSLPVIVFFAIVVKVTSPGPAFYGQKRLGRHGLPYTIWKLRTMRHNCEAGTGAVWAAKNDTRITRVGQFLRDTHMDELPQLFNVLAGQMSLIGPRPERPEIVERLEVEVPDYHERMRVRPGVTGLAQMRLPADTDTESVRKKVAHDIYYIEQMGLIMDARIGLCTAFYFSRAMAEAMCFLLVGKYGKSAERMYESSRKKEFGAT